MKRYCYSIYFELSNNSCRLEDFIAAPYFGILTNLEENCFIPNIMLNHSSIREVLFKLYPGIEMIIYNLNKYTRMFSFHI